MSRALKEEVIIYKGYDPVVVGRFYRFIHPHQWKFLFAGILMILGSTFTVLSPYIVKVAIDDGLRGNSPQTLVTVVGFYVLITLLQWLVTYVRVNLMIRVGQSIIYDLRSFLFEHLQSLSLGFYSRYTVGRVITRVVNDVIVVRDFVTWSVLAIARDVFTLIGIFIAMFILNWQLSLVTFLIYPIMFFVIRWFRKIAREKYRKVRLAVSWVNSVLAENINGVRVVQAFSREKHNSRFFRDEVNHQHLTSKVEAARIASIFPASIELIGAFAVSMVIWMGGSAVLGRGFLGIDVITPGVLVAFVLYIERFFFPIRDLSRRFDALQSTIASGERILSLMDVQPEVDDSPTAVELDDITGQVEFDTVSFSYSDDNAVVIDRLSLKVNPGETIAIVGKTGAGKSTFIKLLARFYDPITGRILIDGEDIKNVTQLSLRRKMGIVLQEPFLFSGSIYENIRFGKLDATQNEIIQTAKLIGSHEFIIKTKDGYETDVKEGGVVLSEGQRQLISITRAALADPNIIILDEATSSIDTQAEEMIQKALFHLRSGRTSFVIAHRLSTIVNADRIIVLDKGRIVEEGTHQQLLDKKGYYYQLYKLGFE